MQIAGTTSQATTTAATTAPVQPLGSPTSTMSQTGNVVMVIIAEKVFCLIFVYIFDNSNNYRAMLTIHINIYILIIIYIFFLIKEIIVFMSQ